MAFFQNIPKKALKTKKNKHKTPMLVYALNPIKLFIIATL